MIQDGDIVHVLSGGASNQNQFASLGGDPSSYPVPNGINNLFENVTADEQEDGLVDYMCFYVFNNSNTETLWNSTVAITDEVAGGSDMALGFAFVDEIQTVTVVGDPTTGSLTLGHGDEDFTFSYNSDLGVWAANFQTAIRTVDGLEDVTVTAQTGIGPSTTVVFTVIFAGTSGKRFHPTLTVTSNGLTPASTVTTSKIVPGSPINGIAPLIDAPTTTPTGVSFYTPSMENPLSIGHLGPTEGYPVWVRRTTAAGSSALASDGGAVLVSGTAFP
jgi:hypothetical protein